MYPDLSYLSYDIIGTNPDQGIFSKIYTYGFLQLISFSLYYYLTLKYVIKYNNDILSIINQTFIIKTCLLGGFVIFLYLQFSFYIFIICLIIITCSILISFVSNNFFNYFFFLFHLLLIGLIGSYFQLIIEDVLINHKITKLVKTGHGFYGGAILIMFYTLFLFTKYLKALKNYLDLSSQYIALSYSIGKLGCHISGDGDWGKVNASTNTIFDFLTKSTYPRNVMQIGCKIENCNYKYCYELCNSVYPLPLYESVFCFFLFILFKLNIYKNDFYILLLNIGIMRFLTDFLKNNTNDLILNLTYSQIVCLILIIIFFLSKTKKSSN